MEIQNITLSDGRVIPSSKMHTLTSLSDHAGVSKSTVYFWKLTNKVEVVTLSGMEFIIEPEKDSPVLTNLKRRKDLLSKKRKGGDEGSKKYELV